MPYIGKTPLTGAYQLCDTITTSATATYNLLVGGSAVIPGSAQNCIVSLNGVIQAPVTAFTVSGSQITFASALTSTDVIDFILILGNVFDIGKPTNGTVTPSSLAGNTSGIFTWQSVKTSGFTAAAGNAYPCNTTSAAFTVTLPASPTAGDQILLLDYAGTFATNNITLGANGNKINGGTDNKILTTNREGVTITYVDSTQGWVASSGVNSGSQALDPAPYSIDFLVIAGGGGAGGNIGGAGGAGGYRTSTQSAAVGTVITVTVGDGGAGGSGASSGVAGSNSSISGSGLTTITSNGGGLGGAGGVSSAVGGNGGSGGGGGGYIATRAGGSGNTPSTSPSQGNNGGSGTGDSSSQGGGGGGGGATATGSNGTNTVGGAGGAGTASSITGSSVTRAGGGGGGCYNGTGGTGGSGGGGAGKTNSGPSGVAGDNGTANTGGGAGAGSANNGNGGTGGKGVVILSMTTTNYSGTTTGSPTVTTSGSNTILTFNGSGSYTA